MSERYGLVLQDFYSQLRHYYEKNIKVYIPGNVSGITQMFVRAYNAKLSRKIIGELYKYIVELRATQQTTLR